MAIALLALVLILLLVLWWRFRPSEMTSEVDLEDTTIDRLIVSQIERLPPVADDGAATAQNYTLGLKQTAAAFAEKYGSYSNHGNFRGLADLKTAATPRFQKYLDSLVLNGGQDIGVYQGFDTRALSVKLNRTDTEDEAEVLVQTQRTKIVGEQRETFYQDLFIKFLRTDDEWKVDEAKWQ